MYNVSKLRAVMAGSGKPYNVLTDLRKQLVRVLHDGYPLADIQDIFSLSEDELQAELNSLLEASLIKLDNAAFHPNFFVADAEETERVVEHAAIVGKQLFETLKEDWGNLIHAFGQLKVAQKSSLYDVGLLLVGANILDIGLLEVLAQDATLLPPAPHRPAPHTPDAHYYFWMIDGNADTLGKYGQRTMGLPYDGWCFFTFGQYQIDEQDNETRRSLEQAVLQASESMLVEALASQFDAMLMTAEEVSRWSPAVLNECERLLSFYRDNESSLCSLFEMLKASQYSDFAEFFCWYNHVAYAAAIDFLKQGNMIMIPESRFAAALWEGGMGPTFFG